jgi:hypothetical protein
LRSIDLSAGAETVGGTGQGIRIVGRALP